MYVGVVYFAILWWIPYVDIYIPHIAHILLIAMTT